MNYYIIIRGPAGVGKTKITKKLAEQLKAKYVSFDKIMRKHNLDTIEGDGISAEKFIKANNLVTPLAKKALENNQIVIFDGCLYRKEQLEHLKKNLPFKHYIFTLKISFKECLLRNKSRKKPMTEKAIEDVYKLVNRFDYGIIINTNNKTEEEIIKEIISHLPNYYDEIAQGYEELHKEEQEKKIELIKQYLKPKQDEKLLDVGCGTGLTTRPWNCKRFGIDPSKKLLEKAINQDPEGEYKLAPAENIPYEDTFFDIIISITAIQNFDNIEKGLKEIKRVGKDNFILTFLKKSQKAENIKSSIQKLFNIKQILEQDKDIIFIINKEN